MGSASIYNASVYNLAAAVTHAVYLDLRNSSVPNIFLNQSVVNDTFVPNLAPPGISPNNWVRDSSSFYYGNIVPPFQTWAQMLLAGLPQNISLGNLTDLPDDSQMVTNYLCPSYQLKPISSFLSSVFIGTATMFMSAWGAWIAISALIAKWISGPCSNCAFGGKECKIHTLQRNREAESGLADNAVSLPSKVYRRDSNYSDLNKSG
ncbi:hypothetical protein FRC07_013326, partial [Ceratobasidium sp. 392]